MFFCYILFRDLVFLERIGFVIVFEVWVIGILYVFVFCIVVCWDLWWGCCYESYSEDLEVVRSMIIIIDGL